MPTDLKALALERQKTHDASASASNQERTISDDSTGQDSQSTSQVSHGSLRELHPYPQTLSEADIEACTVLEAAAFSPEERATKEKFSYRLKCCGEICLGLFTSSDGTTLPTAEASLPVYSKNPTHKAVLIAHICSTRSHGDVVTDDDMRLPDAENPGPNHGHKEHGRTICLHSLAVLPEYQGRGLGSVLMKEYLQRMASQDLADRVAIIAHDHLIPFYEKLGFVNKGPSEAQFGGGGWYDMVKELKPSESSI